MAYSFIFFGNRTATAPAAVTPVFSEFVRPATASLTAAVIATTIIGFVAPPPAQAAVQPTPVFSAFEQPARVKTAAHQQSSVVFNIAPSVAAAFTGFSDFGRPQPTRKVLPDFSNAPQPPAVQNYVFGKYDQPQPKKPPLFDSVQFTIQPPVVAVASQAYVFSAFSQPPPVVRVSVHQQPQPAFEVAQVILAVTPSPLVFTQFSQPAFSQTYKVEQHPEVRFRILRPDAATPGPGIFPPFEQPAFLRAYPAHQQPSVSYALATPQPAAAIVVGGDFADFDFQPKPSKAAQQDFTNAPYFTPQAVAAVTFGGFSDFGKPAPLGKSAQQDFTNAPIAPFVQTYVFSPFEQPQFRKVAQQDQAVRFETGFLGPASTPPWFVFSPFDQPRFGPVIQSEHTSALFEVAQPPQQTLVFSAFEQPRFSTIVNIGQQPSPLFEVRTPDAAIPGPGIFPAFEQPKFSTTFPAWQQASVFFEIAQPPPPPASSGPVFSPFEQPRFYKITYQGDWVAFEIPFQGTTPPKVSDGGGGKKKGIHHTGKHRWKKIKLIDELEELIVELNKLAKLSPKQIVKAPAPVILARYPQPLAEALFDLEQKQSAKAIKASVSRAQAEAEYQLALQQEEDDDDAAFLLLM